jgi:hypothetical protein
VVGLTSSSTIWNSYLFSFFFWLQFPLGAVGFLLLHNLTGGKWGKLIRPVLVGGAKSLFVMLLFLIPLLFAVKHLYPWALPHANDLHPHFARRAKWLNVPFFDIRAIFYALVWLWLAWRLTTDKSYSPTNEHPTSEKMKNFSARGMVLFMLTITFAAFDWVMSQEPDWFSTIFGMIMFVSCGLAMMSLVVIVVGRKLRHAPQDVQKNRVPVFHDLGNLMLALTMLWAYLSFFQLLIIYSANLPEEVVYYTHRIVHGWGVIGGLLIAFGFFAPFFALLQRGIKKSFKWLPWVGLFSILMRFLDIYYVIIPPTRPHLGINLADVGAFVGIGGIWLAIFFMFYASNEENYTLPANFFGGTH